MMTFLEQKKQKPNLMLKDFFAPFCAKRVVSFFLGDNLSSKHLQLISKQEFEHIVKRFQQWTIKPQGSEGYRTAEVTLGGVDTTFLSSKTLECLFVKGLYFIGEVVDVTGWLGGFNFQWAWASGWAAGQVV
jgi:predicted flavoprotein YhiN